MESSLHYMQLLILVTSLEWLWRDQNDFFIGADITIYFSRQQLKNRQFRSPHFFLVKDTEKRPRTSWVVWEEDGRYPDLIIELLSNSTAKVDQNLKKSLYENRFHTPEYFWFSPESLEFAGFKLVGNQYQEIVANQEGYLWSEVLDLYLGVANSKLRYFTSEGELVPTPEEAAIKIQKEAQAAQNQAIEVEQQLAAAQNQAIEAQKEAQAAHNQAIQVEQQLTAEREKSQLLTEQLRVLRSAALSLGIDPDSLR